MLVYFAAPVDGDFICKQVHWYCYGHGIDYMRSITEGVRLGTSYINA